MAKILVLNGPNLNLLGTREPEHYGKSTLSTLVSALAQQATHAGHSLSHYQSNAEHVLIDKIHAAATDGTAIIIINPAAFTHTSLAIADALQAVSLPFIEVHLSNIGGRESFRHHSFCTPHALGVISGFQAHSYHLALNAAIHYLNETQ